MIEELRSAANELHTAWDNYYHVYSALKSHRLPESIPHTLIPELTRQLGAELAFISSYELKVQELKAVIAHTRNDSINCSHLSTSTPINTLFPEILTRIFHLARSQPCNLHRLSDLDKNYVPRYPDYLAQVCVLWRNVAISARSLWCHIDISSYKPYHRWFIARAETHVGRAGELPIDLHMVDHEYSGSRWRNENYSDMHAFLGRIFARVETLAVVTTRSRGFRGFHRRSIRELFSNQPPMLKKLVLRSESDLHNAYIYADPLSRPESNQEFEGLPLNLKIAQIEDSFAPISVLHLRGIFPLWSSKAYCGLVDLRLLSTDEISRIEDVNLITILESSPALQILHFGLDVYGLTGLTSDTQQIQVHLLDLQVIKIFPFKSSANNPQVLRLLAPGTKPLRLSLEGHFIPDEIFIAELEEFFQRSRVARFYTRELFLPMNILVLHATHLERVVLDSFDDIRHDEFPPAWIQLERSILSPRLKSLHITRSQLREDQFRVLVDSCPTDIVFHSCCIRWGNELVSAGELSLVFPNVRTIEHVLYPLEDPTGDWDILD
ncbi:hypothetical protein B0J17DRAFT_771689 [Rhizoctonia solani]|nr:hypothetical protein B0J17DRAFT_771689 [Rhizoctonia solani]